MFPNPLLQMPMTSLTTTPFWTEAQDAHLIHLKSDLIQRPIVGYL